jgi:hypothetical protein
LTTSSLVGGLIGQRCTPPVVCSICNVIMMPLRSGLPDHTGRLKNEEARSGPQPVLPILGVCASPCLGCRSVRGSTGVSVHAGFGQPCGGVAAACGQFCAVGGFSSGGCGGAGPRRRVSASLPVGVCACSDKPWSWRFARKGSLLGALHGSGVAAKSLPRRAACSSFFVWRARASCEVVSCLLQRTLKDRSMPSSYLTSFYPRWRGFVGGCWEVVWRVRLELGPIPGARAHAPLTSTR